MARGERAWVWIVGFLEVLDGEAACLCYGSSEHDGEVW